MKSINYILTTLLIVLSSNLCFGQEPFSKALRAASEGNPSSSIDELSELLFDEEDKVKLGKSYAVLAISYTLQNDNPKEKYEDLLFIIPEDMQNSVGASFVKYLSGKMSSTSFKKAVSNSDNNWKAASEVASYLTLLGNNPELESLNSAAKQYKKLSSNLGGSDWGKAWASRIDKWQDWILKKGGNKDRLEEYITAGWKIRDGNYDIETITEKEYADLRKVFRNRPKEPSLDFDKSKVERYIKSLPEKLRKREESRFTTVSTIKTYIIRVLERSPYPNGVQTRSRKMRGTITMANQNYLVYKTSTRSKKSKRVYWKDLKYIQYADMMEFYANRRTKISGAGGQSQSEMKKDAANEFLGAAILCDWFGDYKKALELGKEAIKSNPSIRDSVNTVLLK